MWTIIFQGRPALQGFSPILVKSINDHSRVTRPWQILLSRNPEYTHYTLFTFPRAMKGYGLIALAMRPAPIVHNTKRFHPPGSPPRGVKQLSTFTKPDKRQTDIHSNIPTSHPKSHPQPTATASIASIGTCPKHRVGTTAARRRRYPLKYPEKDPTSYQPQAGGHSKVARTPPHGNARPSARSYQLPNRDTQSKPYQERDRVGMADRGT